VTEMEIRQVGPEDHQAVQDLVRIMTEAESFENAYPTSHTPQETREALRNRDPSRCGQAFLGHVGGQAVVSGSFELPLNDNTEKAWCAVHVSPGDRRQGHGTRMAEFLVGAARDRGRTTLMTSVGYPFDADESHPDRRFAAKHGFGFSQAEVHRVLTLPADVEKLRQLATAAEPHHRDYTFRDFVGLPDESILEDYCILLNNILVDAPSGKLEFEEGTDTPATIVERVASLADAGRTLYTSIAFDAAGVPVAHSQLVVPAHDPGNVYQWDTLVRRDHRGHRLGIATKVRNLEVVQARHPDRTILHTWNAESNGPMIAVNEAMGFVPARYEGEYYRNL